MAITLGILATLSSSMRQAIVAVSSSSPYVKAWEWSDATGFGTAFSDPATLPTAGTMRDVDFSPTSDAVVFGSTTLNTLQAYTWNNGFGTKYTDGTASNYTSSLRFSPTGGAVAFVYSSGVRVYPWTKASGFGTLYSAPATPPTGRGNGVTFNPAGSVIAVGHDTSPYISTYPWTDASGFGTKYSNPGTSVGSSGESVCFNPAGNVIVIGSTSSVYVHAYAWSGGFGSKYSSPASNPGSNGYAVAFSRAGTTLAVGTLSTPYIHAYPWSAGYGTKYANPASLPGSEVHGIDWSPTDSHMLVSATSSGTFAYAWSSGFGTRTTPSSTLSGSNWGVRFNRIQEIKMTDLTPTAIEMRIAEVAEYESAIALFTTIASNLPSVWPDRLAHLKGSTDKHKVIADIEDLDDVQLVSDLWAYDDAQAAIRSNMVEKRKAEAILAALQA